MKNRLKVGENLKKKNRVKMGKKKRKIGKRNYFKSHEKGISLKFKIYTRA